ncbi:MAG: hypothetical protein ACRD63_12690, partial [Pyrinomonadaceae bacterium]
AEKSVRPKVLGAKPKQAGKKGGGWGEGNFARLLPFPFRLRKEKAEGGFGGNSAFSLRNQNEASPATCLNTWKAGHHRKILFSLREEKIGAAQNEKSKEYFSVVWRGFRAVAGLASLVWFRSAVFDKIGSSQTVKTHHQYAMPRPTNHLHIDGAVSLSSTSSGSALPLFPQGKPIRGRKQFPEMLGG